MEKGLSWVEGFTEARLCLRRLWASQPPAWTLPRTCCPCSWWGGGCGPHPIRVEEGGDHCWPEPRPTLIWNAAPALAIHVFLS